MAMDPGSKNTAKDIFKACYGLIFFGVPNLGLRHDQLLAMAKSSASENLIRDLVVDSDSEQSSLLKELGKKFYDLCKTQDLHVDSYYERERSPTVKVSNGKQLGVSLSSLGLRNPNLEDGRGPVQRR